MKSMPSASRLSILSASFLLGAGVFVSAASRSLPEPSQLPSQPALPDALTRFDGRKVESASMWNKQRRPELKALFEHYMYGTMPPAPRKLDATVDRTVRDYMGGKATKKEVTLRVAGPGAPTLQLLLVIPNQRKGPAPAFVGLTFCGNHAVLNDPEIPLTKAWLPNSCAGCTNNQATERARGTQVAAWSIEQAIDRGYAVATFYMGDLEPDRPEAAEGIRAWFAKNGASYDWGCIATWAWSVSRAVDYLVKDKDIDAKRIAVVGHSRNGKAALVAAAFDERLAMAIPLQAGCGGTAPSRGTIGESVKAINDRFPHWFNARFKQFNTQTDRLPFDQHCLIALCAPRPVLLPNAVEDTWANPDGQFEMLQAASPVYRLLGVEGLTATAKPPVGTRIDSRLGYWVRPGKHSMTAEDWKVFLDFADKHLKRK